jgi:hypothetical protein
MAGMAAPKVLVSVARIRMDHWERVSPFLYLTVGPSE